MLTPSGAVTPSVAVMATGLLPSEVTMPPTAIVFVRVLMVAVELASTGTVIMHVPKTVGLVARGIDPPVMLISVVPAAAVKVPPHVVVAAGVLAIEIPVDAPFIVDRLSVKLVIAAAVVVLRLIRVIVSVDLPVLGMLVGLNAFVPLIEETCKTAEAALYEMPPKLPAETVLV